MGRRLYARKANGRFQKPTLENMLGLSAPPCPSCGRLNPHGVSEPPPENCHACGTPMKMRWGVFVRDAGSDDEWTERFRWCNGKLAPLPDQEAAEARAAETRDLHPEWNVEARQTTAPLPGGFEETFAPLLPETGDAAATGAAGQEEQE